MNWIKDNWFRLLLVLVAIVFMIGVLSYLDSRNNYYDMQSVLEAKDKIAKQDADKRDYVAKRKIDCYSFFEKERKQWSNVLGERYDEVDDTCYVQYTDSGGKYWAGTKCEDLIGPKASDSDYLRHSLCTAGKFENSF